MFAMYPALNNGWLKVTVPVATKNSNQISKESHLPLWEINSTFSEEILPYVISPCEVSNLVIRASLTFPIDILPAVWILTEKYLEGISTKRLCRLGSGSQSVNRISICRYHKCLFKEL